MENIWTEEDEKNWMIEDEKFMKELAKEEEKRYEEDQKILSLVQSKVSEAVFEDIKTSIEMSENTYDYLISDGPIGDYQDDSDFEQWVNQTTNGGYTGDEYAGTVSIKISEKEYFQYSYWM